VAANAVKNGDLFRAIEILNELAVVGSVSASPGSSVPAEGGSLRKR
jgi:hypothetical protein